jgi:hypothetical protein
MPPLLGMGASEIELGMGASEIDWVPTKRWLAVLVLDVLLIAAVNEKVKFCFNTTLTPGTCNNNRNK